MGGSAWIASSLETWSEVALPTDDVPGVEKNRRSNVDHMTGAALAMNDGLDSYVDVRLAMLAFRNVYANQGHSELAHVAALLLSALELNPHLNEAWELLFTHIN